MKKMMLALAMLGLCLIGTDAFAQGIDDYTVLMLHCNGNFADDSSQNHSVTAYGDSQIDAAQTKFGTGSAFFGETGGYLEIADHPDFDLGGEDFTVDFWVKFYDTTQQLPLFGKYDGIYQRAFCLGAASDNTDLYMIYFYSTYDATGDNGARNFQDTHLVADTWYHIALVWDYSAEEIKLYVNGKQHGETGYIPNGIYADTIEEFQIMGYGDWGGKGWLDEFRVSKGIARWTSDFTPPTHEYTVGPVYPPVADAGYDVEAYAGEEVELDGSASYDPDGEITSWVWRCLSDPQKAVIAEGEVATTIAHGYVEELIELTVTDNHGASATDTMKITNPGAQGPQGPPGMTPEEIAVMEGQITALEQENTALQQQNTQQQQMLNDNRYLIEQLPQLRKKIEELETQAQ